MLLTSLKAQPEAMKVPIVWLPKVPQWQNYADVLQKYNFGHYGNHMKGYLTFLTIVTNFLKQPA